MTTITNRTHHRIRVLVIDDDEEDFLITRDLLAAAGRRYQVDWVPTYTAGLDAVRRGEYDVYLVDHQLVAGQGLGLIDEAVRKEGCHQPMILLTGHNREGLDTSSLNVGAADFLTKDDLTPTVLDRAVRHALQRKARERQLRHKAFTDALTGLPNRAGFEDHLKGAVARAKRSGALLAVLYLDLDRFKAVNDTLGHAAGDDLLRQAARRMRGALREGDVLGRLGGDEFVAVMENLPHADLAARAAGRLVDTMAKPFTVQGKPVTVGASVGIALSTPAGCQAATLLSQADEALYRVKESGRGGFAFFHARDAQTAAFGEPVAKALRRALEKEEVFLYYRPRLWAGTGKLAGAQALLHWWHPRRGLIGAGDFVPAAVQAGLALPLSEWLAERLCTDIAGWHKAGVAVPHVSLPLHEGFHQRLNMVALLQRALRCHGLSPDGVLLETNAEVLARHLENDTTAGRMLRARGPKVLLSGGPWEEQTLTRLLRFPVVGLVLKEQWVRSATHQPVELAVLRGVVTTAHSLNLPVVATGVDDAPTMAALSRLGVDQVQGSHVDGPLLTAADVSLKGRFLLE